MERAENAARMVRAVTQVMLDAPRGSLSLWPVMIEILGLEKAFAAIYDTADERNIVKFLIADADNPASIMGSLNGARENARTTREVLPLLAWEGINDLNRFAKEHAPKSVSRNERHAFLSQIVRRSQQIDGLLVGTMSRTAPYQFIRLGRNIERADMTSRILDLGAAGRAQLADDSDTPDLSGPLAGVLWMSVLYCLSAFQMYRQHVQTQIRGPAVVKFLLTDRQFPRAVAHCLDEVESCLQQLPQHQPAMEQVAALSNWVEAGISLSPAAKRFRKDLDRLQYELGEIHTQVARCWFGLAPAA